MNLDHFALSHVCDNCPVRGSKHLVDTTVLTSSGPESSDDASDVRPLNLGPPPPNYSAINASVPGEPNPLTGFHNPNSGYVSEFPPLSEYVIPQCYLFSSSICSVGACGAKKS